jgi:hypothetical protein
MGNLNFSRYALYISAAAALLAGCGGSQPPVAAQGVTPLRTTPALGRSIKLPVRSTLSYQVLFRFGRMAALINLDGTLYGTTAGNRDHSCGTAFELTPSARDA